MQISCIKTYENKKVILKPTLKLNLEWKYEFNTVQIDPASKTARLTLKPSLIVNAKNNKYSNSEKIPTPINLKKLEWNNELGTFPLDKVINRIKNMLAWKINIVI